MSQILPLQCRCGAIQLEVRGAPNAQFFCHCDDCQLMHGAAYVPESVYPADAVRVTSGTPFSWSLKRNPRLGCPRCGTRLFVDVLAARLRLVREGRACHERGARCTSRCCATNGPERSDLLVRSR
ncbi:MAG: GFA family protein [Deltaproteobacteria bacterium]